MALFLPDLMDLPAMRLVDEPLGSEPFDKLRVSSKVEKLKIDLPISSRCGVFWGRQIKLQIYQSIICSCHEIELMNLLIIKSRSVSIKVEHGLN